MRISDWSSDVCSSDLETYLHEFLREVARQTAPEIRIVDRDLLEGELLALFHDPRRLAWRDLEEVRRYLGGPAGSDGRATDGDRSEARRAGKECVSPCRTRG